MVVQDQPRQDSITCKCRSVKRIGEKTRKGSCGNVRGRGRETDSHKGGGGEFD